MTCDYLKDKIKGMYIWYLVVKYALWMYQLIFLKRWFSTYAESTNVIRCLHHAVQLAALLSGLCGLWHFHRSLTLLLFWGQQLQLSGKLPCVCFEICRQSLSQKNHLVEVFWTEHNVCNMYVVLPGWILTVCGFIFPVIKSNKSVSDIDMVQSAFLSVGQRSNYIVKRIRDSVQMHMHTVHLHI